MLLYLRLVESHSVSTRRSGTSWPVLSAAALKSTSKKGVELRVRDGCVVNSLGEAKESALAIAQASTPVRSTLLLRSALQVQCIRREIGARAA